MAGKRSGVLLAAVLILLVVTGCLPGKAVKGADQEAVVAYTEPIADRIFEGLDTNDYALFSQDFDETMRENLDEASFQQLSDLLSSKIGSYQSREVSSVREVDGRMLVIYTAVFSDAKQVVINLSITGSEPHLVAGLYFNAPELNK
jgi:hypothetical protein